MSTKPEQYVAIQMWCDNNEEHVAAQQAKAAAEGAPLDAIFKHISGKWARVSELPSGHSFRERYINHIRGRKQQQ